MKKITNNLGLKLLSLLAACVIWLVVVNIDDPVSTRVFSNITVNVINEDVVTGEGKLYNILDNSNVISVTVKAKRSVLDSFTSDDFEATADMKEMDASLGLVPIEVTAKKNSNKVEEITTRTKNLRVSIEDYSTKQFAITASVVGTPAEGFAVGDITINPNVVKVSGPASSMDKIGKVVVKIDVEGMGTKLNLKLAPVLLDQYGNEISTSGFTLNYTSIDVEVQMVHTKNIPIKFNVTGTPAAGYTHTGTEISSDTITLKGNTEALAAIQEINLPDRLFNIAGATESVQQTLDITDYLPRGVEPVNAEEKSVVISIMIEKIETRTLAVSTSKIKVNNLTMGFDVSFSADSINVELSGYADVIEKLTESGLTAEVDLSSYTSAGTYTVPVTVTAPSGVSVLNKITVDVVIIGG